MIEVIHPGIYCSVQDEGRFGFAKIGIPMAGVMDQFSAHLGNSLLKNQKTDALIEVTFGMAKFKFNIDTFICITGADFSQKLNDDFINTQEVYKVKKGSILSFGKRNHGFRTYIAVKGGIQSEIVLKSRSFSKEITSKIRLEKGDKLSILAQKFIEYTRFSKVKIYESHFLNPNLECFPGPEFDRLNNSQKQQLLMSFTISEDNNRVGYQLNEVLENNLAPILTSAVMPGTVQLTPSGKLVILMRDCQVTGGYPRVLQLSEVAISKMSQKIRSDHVKFVLNGQ